MLIKWRPFILTINLPFPQSNWSAWVEWSDEDNCYIATCPQFKHVSAHGDTEAEALDELRTALTGVIEVYREMGWTLPDSLAG